MKKLGFDRFELPDVSSFAKEVSTFDSSDLTYMNDVIARQHRERVDREEKIAEAANYTLTAATIAVKHLVEEIEHFEQKLSEHEEVALWVIGGPAGQQFFPITIKALNPDKVLYGGVDQAERPFSVVQHVSQLNFAMTATYLESGEPRRFGVLHDHE